MITKEMLGKRVRDVRIHNSMTLKDVEGLSGLSATHISEIERGMTCPTVGALVRIALALKKDPCFFVEERELDEVCVSSEGDRPTDVTCPVGEVGRARVEPLTRGIPGGRIRAHELKLDPHSRVEIGWLTEGQDVCFYCIEGSSEVKLGGSSLRIMPGDSIHGALPEGPWRVSSSELGCRLLVVSDRKEDPR